MTFSDIILLSFGWYGFENHNDVYINKTSVLGPPQIEEFKKTIISSFYK